MYLSTKELLDYKIKASDGEIGSVDDVYFDDSAWAVRYVVVDTGGWLFGRKVLIAPHVIGEPDEHSHLLPVSLTTEQVKHSPDITMDPPISREQEVEIHDYYHWPYYWGSDAGGSPMIGVAPEAMLIGDTRVTPEPRPVSDEERAVRLRNVRDVTGYTVRYHDHAAKLDYEVGEVTDFLLDASEWTLPYLVVKLTGDSESRTVLLPNEVVHEVAWPEHFIDISVPVAVVNAAPAYDGAPLDQRYCEALARHYNSRINSTV